MPETIRQLVNDHLGPVSFFALSVLAFTAMVVLRSWWTRPRWAAAFSALAFVLFAASLRDPAFRRIVTKPDNVAIVILFLLLGFFLWLSFRKMVINDRLLDRKLPTVEARESTRRVLCWPDLLYSEFLCLILVTILLVVWSLCVRSPLEEFGHPTRTANPSKAPWYFLGLQELLVYFDPWLAGVVFPLLIIFGLCAIPYLDTNPRGNGYYTFRERPLAIVSFLFGFVVLWILLIALGTFFRGPGWEFFGPFERWDIHKVGVHTSVNLSDWVFGGALGRAPPESPLLREAPGLLLIAGYFGIVPVLLARTLLRRLRRDLGRGRYYVAVWLLLGMAALPIKMVMHWSLNLKYVVSIPEWAFNI